MVIVQSVQSTAYPIYKAMAQDITSFNLANYKGESIDEYVLAIRPKIEELDSADLLPPDINSIILKHFVGCSVEIFRAHFSPKLIAEEDFLMKSLNLPLETKKLLKDYVSYHSLLNEGLTLYRRLYDSGLWSAPKAAVSLASSGLVKNPSGNPTSTPKGDKEKTTDDGPKSGHKGKTKDPWKEQAPKTGQSHTRKVSGTYWYWCAKCANGHGRWTRSHLTEEHKGKQDDSKKGSAAKKGSYESKPSVSLALKRDDSDDDSFDGTRLWAWA
jgi:hypothetical protein